MAMIFERSICLALFGLFVGLCAAFRGHNRVSGKHSVFHVPSVTRRFSGNGDTGQDGASTGIDAARLWQDTVEYVELASVDVEQSGIADKSVRELPLFVLGAPFYPKGNNYLNVFEMKYRTMMFDCSNKDDKFGYIFSDPSGQIAAYGTICKIVDRELLEDGRQYIAFQGESRFKIRRILKTLPYVTAEVEVDIEDTQDASIAEQCAELEREVYNSLKYYVRLMKEYPRTKNMLITSAAKAHRPTENSAVNDHERRSAFSFSLANMIQMGQPREGQLLLQTTSVYKRLEAERMILQSAVENVVEQLLKINVITPERQAEIRAQSFNSHFDDDILPPDVASDVTEADTDDEWTLQ